MNYEVKINGQVIENVKVGFTLTDRIDEQFDTALIIQLNSSNSSPIPPRSTVTIKINDSEKDTYNYIINADRVVQTCYDPALFEHSISLISLEKIYDYETMPALAFTNSVDGEGYSYYDQLDRIRRVHPLEIKGYHDQTRLFDIDIQDEVIHKQAPQLTLGRGTMYQAISSTLKPLDLVPKVYSGLNLDVKYVNKLNNLINPTNYSNYSTSNSLEYYAGAVESEADNAITSEQLDEGICWFPSKTTWVSFRSSAEGQVLSSDYYTIKLPNNIYKLLRVKAKVYHKAAYNMNEGYIEEELDLTDYIFERDKWNLLDVGDSLNPYAGKTKMNCAYYDYNGTSIDGFSENQKWLVLFTKERIKFLIGCAYRDATGFAATAAENEIIIEKTLFRVSYIPFTKILVKSYKDSQLLTGTINVSSSSNIVDLKRLGRNLKGMINRVGNGDLSLKIKAKTPEELISVGDYTLDGYVATVCEKQFFDDFIQEIVEFSKDYNRISQYIGIDTEYRSYEIPRSGIIRHLHYDDFVVVSDNNKPGNVSCIDNLDWVYNAMTNNLTEDFSINNALVQTYDQSTTVSTFSFNLDFEQDKTPGGDWSEIEDIPEVPYIRIETGEKETDFTYCKILIINNNDFEVEYVASSSTVNFDASGKLTAGESVIYDYIEARGNVEVTVDFYASGKKSATQSITHKLSNGVTSSDAPPSSDTNNGVYINGCWALTHSYSTDKAVCFSFGFEDTIKAGDATGDQVTGGYKQIPVKYTNDEGRFYYMDFSLYPTLNLAGDIEKQSKSYPLVTSVDTSGVKNILSTKGRKLVVDKDPSEIIKMTYQINFASEVKSINIGNAFSDRCMLVSEQTLGGLKLYVRDSIYGKKETDIVTEGIDTLVENGCTITNGNNIKITVNNQNKYWCLANDNGEIYLTCNDNKLTVIYIKPTHYFITRKEGE